MRKISIRWLIWTPKMSSWKFFLKEEYGNCSRLKKADKTWQSNVIHEPLLESGSQKRKSPVIWGSNWENLNMGYILDDTESLLNFSDVIAVLDLYRMSSFSGDLC